MKSANASIIAGIVLMMLGVLLMLDRVGVLESGAIVAPLVFAAAGALFLSVFVRRREHWWAAIPGSVFLGLAAVITSAELTGSGASAGFLFLFMGAGFAAVYARVPANWWAIIPAGVMLTLAVIVALPPAFQGTLIAAVLFLGLAATFGVLALVPVRPADGTGTGTSGGGHLRWPLIPAGVLAVLGVIMAIRSSELLIPLDFAVPAVMIAAGTALVVYAFLARTGKHSKVRGPGQPPSGLTGPRGKPG
ncbi:hypothetical protein QE394_000688 [Arthrobacter sp. SORGH_AS 212]|uniref:hypothetical protein n=1 Tax=Pseudarthrobacter sp. SORGH_AS 212 TaxID=3041777 RepID=UPI00278324DC|nr:hypothetical protein [Arthrobacter sp. SORGH_AS_0212]